MQITVFYQAIDGARITRQFKTLKGANRFAAEYVGDHPTIGAGYAVSDDGVGKVTVTGCSLRELFSGCDASADKRDIEHDDFWRSEASALARQAQIDADEEYRPRRTTGCVCCDEQLYRVGCDCPAENPPLPF